MTVTWEKIEVQNVGVSRFEITTVERTARAKVPGGWLIAVVGGNGGGVTFFPDPRHEWDGNSLA